MIVETTSTIQIIYIYIYYLNWGAFFLSLSYLDVLGAQLMEECRHNNSEVAALGRSFFTAIISLEDARYLSLPLLGIPVLDAQSPPCHDLSWVALLDYEINWPRPLSEEKKRISYLFRFSPLSFVWKSSHRKSLCVIQISVWDCLLKSSN